MAACRSRRCRWCGAAVAVYRDRRCRCDVEWWRCVFAPPFVSNVGGLRRAVLRRSPDSSSPGPAPPRARASPSASRAPTHVSSSNSFPASSRGVRQLDLEPSCWASNASSCAWPSRADAASYVAFLADLRAALRPPPETSATTAAPRADAEDRSRRASAVPPTRLTVAAAGYPVTQCDGGFAQAASCAESGAADGYPAACESGAWNVSECNCWCAPPPATVAARARVAPRAALDAVVARRRARSRSLHVGACLLAAHSRRVGAFSSFWSCLFFSSVSSVSSCSSPPRRRSAYVTWFNISAICAPGVVDTVVNMDTYIDTPFNATLFDDAMAWHVAIARCFYHPPSEDGTSSTGQPAKLCASPPPRQVRRRGLRRRRRRRRRRRDGVAALSRAGLARE